MSLSDDIREKIAYGNLPVSPPATVWAGFASSATCVVWRSHRTTSRLRAQGAEPRADRLPRALLHAVGGGDPAGLARRVRRWQTLGR
jgi:hypothetical protein